MLLNDANMIKPSQIRRDEKNFSCTFYLNPFLQLAAEKNDSKNGATRKFCGPSYFDPTLGEQVWKCQICSPIVLALLKSKIFNVFCPAIFLHFWRVWTDLTCYAYTQILEERFGSILKFGYSEKATKFEKIFLLKFDTTQ